MARVPLIRFRYAIEKAAKAGLPHPIGSLQGASESTVATSAAQNKIPGPPGVVRTSIRIEKSIPRAKLADDEMDAIMVGYYPINQLYG